MGKKEKTGPVPLATWRACDEPVRLLRWSRRVSSPRRFLLLCCAIVRNWPAGVRTEVGRQVLEAVEQEARTRPLRNVRLCEDVLTGRFPGLFQPAPRPHSAGPYDAARAVSQLGHRQLGADAGWAWLFACGDLWVRRTTKALPNLLIPTALAAAHVAGHAEGTAELTALRKEFRPNPSGVLARLFGPSNDQQLREAIVARLPDPSAPPRFGTVTTLWQAEMEYRDRRARQTYRRTAAAACGLIREIFGDPFRPWRVRPEWLAAHNGAVGRIAEHVEESGNFGELPYLGDALEDAGCADEAALAHCRQPAGHICGCWVLDLLRGG